MTLTAFLKFEDIDGESRADQHEDEIDIHGLRWGVEHSDPDGPRARSGGKVDPLKLHKYFDAASPYLAKTCYRGKIHRQVVLTVRRMTAGTPQDYLTITLTNARITDVALVNDHDDDDPIHEVITLVADHYEMTYLETDNSGAVEDDHTVKFDLTKGA